jgi:hypothetical protein
MRLNEATPFSSQATASPSMMQERERRCAKVSTISGKAGEVVARTAIEPHLRAILAGNDAEAVVLDFVQPLAAERQLLGFCWKARRDESGREGTLQHARLNTFGQRRLQLHHQKPAFFCLRSSRSWRVGGEGDVL